MSKPLATIASDSDQEVELRDLHSPAGGKAVPVEGDTSEKPPVPLALGPKPYSSPEAKYKQVATPGSQAWSEECTPWHGDILPSPFRTPERKVSPSPMHTLANTPPASLGTPSSFTSLLGSLPSYPSTLTLGSSSAGGSTS